MNVYTQKAIRNNAGLRLMPENVNKATQVIYYIYTESKYIQCKTQTCFYAQA